MGLLVSVFVSVCLGAPDGEVVGHEPDWDAVTGGNWSPWVMASDGTQEWNPVAGFNSWIETIPVEDRAWPILIDARYKFDLVFADSWSSSLPERDLDEWAARVEILKLPETADALSQVKDALRRKHLGKLFTEFDDPATNGACIRHGLEDEIYDGQENPNLAIMRGSITELSQLRNATRFAISFAIYRLQLGDTDGFVELIELTNGAVRFAQESPNSISHLLSVAIQRDCYETVLWALECHDDVFSEEHLERLALSFQSNQLGDVSMLGDVMLFHDMCRRVVNGVGGFNLDGMNPQRALDVGFEGDPTHVAFAGLHESVQQTMLLYEKMMCSGASGRLYIREVSNQHSEDIFEREKDPSNFVGNQLIDVAEIAVGKLSLIHIEYLEGIGNVRLAIAIYRYKLRHGVFPASIAELDEDLMGFTPLDGYTGEPLSYRLTESGPVIYSFGFDLDDDGGRHVVSEYPRSDRSADGDFVHFPHQFLQLFSQP